MEGYDYPPPSIDRGQSCPPGEVASHPIMDAFKVLATSFQERRSETMELEVLKAEFLKYLSYREGHTAYLDALHILDELCAGTETARADRIKIEDLERENEELHEEKNDLEEDLRSQDELEDKIHGLETENEELQARLDELKGEDK